MTQYADRAYVMQLLQAVHHLTAIDAAIRAAKAEDYVLKLWGMELRLEYLATYGKEFES